MNYTKKRIIIVGSIIGSLFFLSFLFIAVEILTKAPLGQLDLQVLESLVSWRTPFLNNLFTAVTFIANWQSIIIFSLITILLLARRKQYFTSLLFFFTLLTAQGSVAILKVVVGRSRPDELLQLIVEDRFSFPSGHTMAATLVFGFWTYLTWKSLKNIWVKGVFTVLGSLMVFFVAFSRMYLGVHFPSDVLASIFLGAFLLTVLITISELNEHFQLFQKQKIAAVKEILFLPFLLMLFSLIFHAYFIVLKIS